MALVLAQGRSRSCCRSSLHCLLRLLPWSWRTTLALVRRHWRSAMPCWMQQLQSLRSWMQRWWGLRVLRAQGLQRWWLLYPCRLLRQAPLLLLLPLPLPLLPPLPQLPLLPQRPWLLPPSVPWALCAAP
jgi:hypothetical protein